MAVTIGAGELLNRAGVTDPREQHRYLIIAETAAISVDNYARDAPVPISNEAAVRMAGWLLEVPTGSVSAEAVGDVSTSYATSHLSALRHSGAMALLSPWKIRRGGAI